MILYDQPGEVRVTADHKLVATIKGSVTVSVTAPNACTVKFHPDDNRIARSGWRWRPPGSQIPCFVRASVYTAGERVAEFPGDHGTPGGWWLRKGNDLTLAF